MQVQFSTYRIISHVNITLKLIYKCRDTDLRNLSARESTANGSKRAMPHSTW